MFSESSFYGPQALQPPVPCRIIGSGRMAAALADALPKQAGGHFYCDGIYARSAAKAENIAAGAARSGSIEAVPEPNPDAITLLAVSDAAIAEVAGKLVTAGKAGCGLFVHTSGAVGPEPLAAIREAGGNAGSFHPLQSFSKGAGADAFRHISISLLCDRATHADLLAALARQLGARPLRVTARQKRQLHLAAVMASNYMVALLHLAELSASELEEPLLPHLRPLLEQTLENVLRQGTAGALTGPVSRGDAGTIRAHLAELETLTRQAPDVSETFAELMPAYRQLGRVAAALARADGRLTPAQLSGLLKCLKNND